MLWKVRESTKRELSTFSQMLFILLFYSNAIHYTLLWSWVVECLQSITPPKDKANCCCTAIVFKVPFCGRRANCCTNKTHGCTLAVFFMWWVLIMEHDSLFPFPHLCFPRRVLLRLFCFSWLGWAGLGCVPRVDIEVVSASLVPTLGKKTPP